MEANDINENDNFGQSFPKKIIKYLCIGHITIGTCLFIFTVSFQFRSISNSQGLNKLSNIGNYLATLLKSRGTHIGFYKKKTF